jgi:hypothetical protein
MAEFATLAPSQVESNGENSRSPERWRRALDDFREMLKLPRVEVNLMLSATRENDPFYQRLVLELYASTRRRHPRFPLIRQKTFGVALARLPDSFDQYFMAIEAAGRRNVKKARRLGYRFAPIRFNDHIADVTEIRRSTDRRQGPMPKEFLQEEVNPCTDPPSTTQLHEWPYFGVLKDEKLFAYAGCFICGEICFLEHIYGHSAFHSDGIVPMLIVGIAQHLIESRPSVRYYCYSNYFGASITLRRFQRKFLFLPHKVKWVLG